MRENLKHKKQGVMEWLYEIVESNPEAKKAYEDEKLRLDLSSALKTMREMAGMTQAMVAEQLGVPQSQISKLEKPNHNHTIETIKNYLRVIGADLIIGFISSDKCKVIPASALAENIVFLPDEVKDQALAKGLTLREHVLSCMSEDDAKQEMVSLMRKEWKENINVLMTQIPTQERGRKLNSQLLSSLTIVKNISYAQAA